MDRSSIYYKILLETDSKLVSTKSVPKWLEVTYLPDTWITGVHGSSLFVLDNLRAASARADLEVNVGEKLWVVTVIAEDVRLLENGLSVWKERELFKQEHAEEYLQTFDKFWKATQRAWKANRQPASRTATKYGKWGPLTPVFEFTATRVRLLKPWYIVQYGKHKNIFDYVTAEDLARIGWNYKESHED